MADRTLNVPTQPVREDLANALYIADLWATQGGARGEARDAFTRVARLIRHALDQLSEPNAGAIRAARTFFVEADELNERGARDLAAAVIHAQLSGEAP